MSSQTPWWSVSPEQGAAKVSSKGKGRTRFIVFSSLLLLILIGAAFCVPRERAYSLDNGSIQNPPTLNDIIASCSGIVEWPLLPSGWLSGENAHVYPFFPPTSGTFAPIPAAPRFYDEEDENLPTVPEAMSALWRGNIVVWYSPLISAEDKALLRSVARVAPGEADYVVLPWVSGDGVNEGSFAKRPVVLTAWGLSQSCGEASEEVFSDFSMAAEQSPAPGVNVPAGEMGPKGVEP